MLLAAVVGILGLYWKDKLELKTLQRQFVQEQDGQSAQYLLQKIEYRQQVARARPDLLHLLDLLRQTMPKEALLDQFTFEKGRPVEVRGTAASYEQVYEFHKKLQEQDDIRQLQLIEPTLDEKSGKVSFKIRFAYKNFSR